MTLKYFSPVTSSTRGLVLIERSSLWRGRPDKELVVSKPSTGGRNNLGRITCRHRGGGHKRLLRNVDFKRSKLDVLGTVERIEYDPNRSAFIALIQYSDFSKAYILAPQRLSVGDSVISSESAEIKPGNTMLLKNIPVGTVVHNVEMKISGGAQLCRAAGTYAQVVGRDVGFIIVRLSSGEVRYINPLCKATIGAVSNPDNKNEKLGKAGRVRWLGIRPSVRGVAMNPIDHPHGGGNGKTSSGRPPVSFSGVLAKGYKTRSLKKASNKFIIKHRNGR